MSSKKTFILGAGASIPYGYPSGKNLICKIVNHIEKDKIYFPRDDNYLKNPVFSLHLLKETLPFLNISDLVRLPSAREFGNISLSDHSKSFFVAYSQGSGCLGVEINLSDILEFSDFRKALIEHSPLSIDEFLSMNPKYAEVGKCMIIYTLMQCESLSTFHLDYDFEEKEIEEKDNWYPYLLSDLLSGCAENPSNILQSNVSIISFNYDVSLDFYIKDRLSKIEKIDNMIKESPEILDQYKIYHVYGSVYGDTPYVYGAYASTNEKDITQANTLRLAKSLELQSNISIISEERPANSIYKDIIMSSDELIIIGFGFNRTNLNQLSFPKVLSGTDGYEHFFANKIIRYMNYKGEMSALDAEFERIERSLGIQNIRTRITASHSNRISTAYFRDFQTTILLQD